MARAGSAKGAESTSVTFGAPAHECAEPEGDEFEPCGICMQCDNDDGWLVGWQAGEADGWRCRACDAPLLCSYCSGPPTPRQQVAVALSESRLGCCARHAP